MTKKELEVIDKGEFMRVNPHFIKVESGGLWREENPQDLEALKSSIVWRERRMKGSGLLMPLLVSKIAGTDYLQLEDGLRRFRAIQSLILDGVSIENVPVRVLPAPLTMSEKLMLTLNGPKPLSPLEESRMITRLEKQGLSFENMARLMNRPEEALKKRALLSELKGSLFEALKTGQLKAEELELAIDIKKTIEEQRVDLEKEFAPILSRVSVTAATVKKAGGKALGDVLGKQEKAFPLNEKTAWVPKILDPAVHFVSLEGLYEWMGGDNAGRQGYSKNVVEIVKLMLKYSGGKMGLLEIAEKLKKFK